MLNSVREIAARFRGARHPVEGARSVAMQRATLSIAESLTRDVRYAIRSLRRDMGATTFAIAIAGLGIGASPTVFSICNALLLRPLPFEEPDRLVWIANGTSETLSAQTVQVANLLDLRGSRAGRMKMSPASTRFMPPATSGSPAWGSRSG